MVHVDKLEFNNDSNLGMYGIATDKFVLLGRSVPRKHVKKLEDIFGVPVLQAKIYGTDLIGIFAAATSKVVLVPHIVFKDELAELKKVLRDIAKVKTFKTRHTALANNLLINDKAGFASTDYSKEEVAELQKLLDVTLQQVELAGTNVPGSAGVLTNKGAIFSSNLTDKEIQLVEKQVGFEIGLGSVNMGNTLLGSGIIANSNGFIIGQLSSGYEIARVDESLGFLD